jgi:hypothetical protein
MKRVTRTEIAEWCAAQHRFDVYPGIEVAPTNHGDWRISVTVSHSAHSNAVYRATFEEAIACAIYDYGAMVLPDAR